MVPRLAPWAPSITDTPPTPIEHQESPIAEQRRSRSQQLLDTFMHEARSRSSSGSSRHSKSPDGVKGVLANLGLAAATVGAEHIKPKSPHDEDVREGVKVFLSALQNIILRRARTGCGDDVETIEVGDDAQSVHSFNPITEAHKNPFGISEEVARDTAAECGPSSEQQAGSPLAGDTWHQHVSLSRETSFGEFVTDIFMYEKGSGEKVPGRARLDTGMTCNAIRYSHAQMVGYPIEQYKGDPCKVGDGRLFDPLGQVTIPFHFVNSGNARQWHVEFIVFPEESPFDICLGRRFISLANLLKRNEEALPVEFPKLRPSEERVIKYKTHQASRESEYTKDKEDSRYDDRRRTKPKEKESKRWY